MKIFYRFSLLILFLLVVLQLPAQVKSSYLYSTKMPYGILDIRTKISSTHYYYLQAGKTFAFRESQPGVRTNSYFDMTSWDSSPYQQGNLRKKNGTSDLFIMNYRLLIPLNYSSSYADGYPLMVLFHGAVERGNCYYNQCYHSNWDYDPNVNNPPAPKTATHKLLNNDHHLTQGGKQHLDARNKAAGKLPHDPFVSGRMFPGFVLVPQMLNVWDSLNVQDVIRLVQLVAQQYNVNKDRIYVHGLSIGGYAVYEALKRAPWLFASGQPMAAVRDASIFRYGLQSKVSHIPFWIFQGANDKDPSPVYTGKLVNDLRNAGASVRYSLYPNVGHTCWHKAFAEPEFYSWMLAQGKNKISVFKGITVINASKGQYPKLLLAEGFHAYQWEKDGTIISTAKTHTLTVKSPGKYRARFSRVPNPTAAQWNTWSPTVTITTGSGSATARASGSQNGSDSVSHSGKNETRLFSLSVYPNPASDYIRFRLATPEMELPVTIEGLNVTGEKIFSNSFSPGEITNDVLLPLTLPNGVYLIVARQGHRVDRLKVIVRR